MAMGIETNARQEYLDEKADEPMSVCDNCEKEYTPSELVDITHYWERVEAGCEVPSGECPDDECGALCFLKKEALTPAEIKELILHRGLTVTNVIDVVCELNGFVGVGFITFGDQLKDYVYAKARTGVAREGEAMARALIDK